MILAALQIAAVSVTNVPEFILSQDEGERLAKLSANALRHYEFGGLGLTEKAKDTFFALAAFGEIAFAHSRAYYMRKRADAARDVTPHTPATPAAPSTNDFAPTTEGYQQ